MIHRSLKMIEETANIHKTIVSQNLLTFVENNTKPILLHFHFVSVCVALFTVVFVFLKLTFLFFSQLKVFSSLLVSVHLIFYFFFLNYNNPPKSLKDGSHSKIKSLFSFFYFYFLQRKSPR